MTRQQQGRKVASCCPVYYHPEKRALHAVLGDRDDEHHAAWRDALETTGCQVTIGASGSPQSANLGGSSANSPVAESEAVTHGAVAGLCTAKEDWIRIKRADGALGFFNKPFEWGGKLTGGPSPLSNALVGSLLTGGLGYGTGWLLEHLFPERYVQRGKLPRTLGQVYGNENGAEMRATDFLGGLWESTETRPVGTATPGSGEPVVHPAPVTAITTVTPEPVTATTGEGAPARVLIHPIDAWLQLQNWDQWRYENGRYSGPEARPADDFLGLASPGEPCPTCGGLSFFTDLLGGRHCQTCEAGLAERTFQLVERAERLRLPGAVFCRILAPA